MFSEAVEEKYLELTGELGIDLSKATSLIVDGDSFFRRYLLFARMVRK